MADVSQKLNEKRKKKKKKKLMETTEKQTLFFINQLNNTPMKDDCKPKGFGCFADILW